MDFFSDCFCSSFEFKFCCWHAARKTAEISNRNAIFFIVATSFLAILLYD
ncbi:hypothetical protein [Rummeliibacillus pycnus]